jgi:hypothetical protein
MRPPCTITGGCMSIAQADPMGDELSWTWCCLMPISFRFIVLLSNSLKSLTRIPELASFKMAVEKLIGEGVTTAGARRFNRITTKTIADLVGTSADFRGEMKKV